MVARMKTHFLVDLKDVLTFLSCQMRANAMQMSAVALDTSHILRGENIRHKSAKMANGGLHSNVDEMVSLSIVGKVEQ
jgi:hypothetical protein